MSHSRGAFQSSGALKRRLWRYRSGTGKSPLKTDIAVEGLRFESIGAILSELVDLQQKVDSHEELIFHSLQPAASKMTAYLERMGEVSKRPILFEVPDAITAKVAYIMETIEALVHEFDDLHDRLSHYTLLQGHLKELIDIARKQQSQHFRAAILTLYDATYSVYSEDLTVDQIQVLRTATRKLFESPITKETVRSLDKEMRIAGFETVPSDQFQYSQHA